MVGGSYLEGMKCEAHLASCIVVELRVSEQHPPGREATPAAFGPAHRKALAVVDGHLSLTEVEPAHGDAAVLAGRCAAAVPTVAEQHGARHARALGHARYHAFEIVAAELHELLAVKALVGVGVDLQLAATKAARVEWTQLKRAGLVGHRVGECVGHGLADVGDADVVGAELDTHARAHPGRHARACRARLRRTPIKLCCSSRPGSGATSRGTGPVRQCASPAASRSPTHTAWGYSRSDCARRDPRVATRSSLSMADENERGHRM